MPRYPRDLHGGVDRRAHRPRRPPVVDLGGGGAAREPGEGRGLGERLDAAVIAAAARRSIRFHDLVADLAGLAVPPEVEPAVDHHATAPRRSRA